MIDPGFEFWHIYLWNSWMYSSFFFFLKNVFIFWWLFFTFIYLAASGLVACKIFVVSCKIFSVHGLSSCGTWAPEHAGSGVMAHWLDCSMAFNFYLQCNFYLVFWPGIEPTSPAFQGKLLTTAPPEKSLGCTLNTEVSFSPIS